MILIFLSVVLIALSGRYSSGTPAFLRVALIANAIALIADALSTIYRMKEGKHDAENI